MHARYLDGIALLLMIVTVAFLITPESYHQIVDIGTDTTLPPVISRMAGVSLLPFALSLGIALFITGESIFGFSAGLAAGCFFILLALGCWYVLQYLRPRQAGRKERTISARQQITTEDTSLDKRITQMLTEARVVLPGAQALLGFQLASVISQSFEKLPASSKGGPGGEPRLHHRGGDPADRACRIPSHRLFGSGYGGGASLWKLVRRVCHRTFGLWALG